MMIQFKINKEYANRYTESRRKEELQKLRDRYGDVKIGGKRTKTESKGISSEKEEQDGETSDSSSSDSGTSDYSTFSDDDHEDFLVLYDALCRNDASLDDPNKNWFREKIDPYTPDEQQVIKTEPDLGNGFYSHTVEKNKKKKQSSLKLRDYERKFLLEDRGLENEDVAADAARISKMESDQILETLTESTADAAKRNFLRESATALEQAGISSTTSPGGSQDLDFLQRRATDSKKEPRTKIPIDVGNLRFTDTSNAEAEEFLRDYIVNRRWKRPKESLPSYEEVLRNANMNFDSAPLSTTSQLFDGDISEDDEFLIKAREFERANQEGNSVVSRGFDGPTIPKHRFQEEDKEFVKSYPRKIETSLQNPTIDGKSSRSLKREARKARKLKEKQARMEELERLRRMKLAMFADKIDRIRRSCGAGCSIPVVTPDEPFVALKTTSNRRALDLAMYLDEDWDPEQHNKVLEEMFGDSYYDITENEHSLPHFSDISDVDSDELPKVKSERNGFRLTSNGAVSEDSHGSEAVRSSNASDAKGIAIQDHKSFEFSDLFTGRKAHSRRTHHRDKSFSNTTMNPEAEAYFDEHTKLTCDDIIQGSTPDDHIYCRFPYRQVSANDFGLSTEEVLKASTRELNSWVSIRRVAGYLTEEEEERNRRVFHSRKKLHKKPQVLASLNDPNAHWWPESNKNPTTSTASGQTKKRSRKKKKNKGVKLEQLVDDISKTKKYSQTKSEAPNPDSTCPRPRTKKIKGLNISLARLSASGLTSKDLYRVRNKSKHTDSSNITSPK